MGKGPHSCFQPRALDGLAGRLMRWTRQKGRALVWNAPALLLGSKSCCQLWFGWSGRGGWRLGLLKQFFPALLQSHVQAHLVLGFGFDFGGGNGSGRSGAAMKGSVFGDHAGPARPDIKPQSNILSSAFTFFAVGVWLHLFHSSEDEPTIDYSRFGVCLCNVSVCFAHAGRQCRSCCGPSAIEVRATMGSLRMDDCELWARHCKVFGFWGSKRG